MALVSYSDSEDSDVGEQAPPVTAPSKPAFQKIINPLEPRKLKVDLPTIHPDPSEQDEAPPTKRAKTGGTFGGFNSFLPAPKKAASLNVPKAGVSLRTSSEAAFSRAPPPAPSDQEEQAEEFHGTLGADAGETTAPKAEEHTVVAKATKFKPLSVANKKKAPNKKVSNGSVTATHVTPAVAAQDDVIANPKTTEPPPKPKRSLFSVPQEEEQPQPSFNDTYEPITQEAHEPTETLPTSQQPLANPPNPNHLQALTPDLNLTPAQRRQLFGRNGKGGDVQIAHFNMEHEYAANEQLRQAGEVVEHRAVKAIAPGKHSLQQLVNNARSQQDAMEDKWSQGKAARGEGGAKYGWSR
ncbi:mitotic checkpoint regulator, MAD2B-interacting-domain-containing protein [Neohortaea acidophila]|uniref:Mitotic checkpoint regulator, MAD2B-interacting-domain-containing protein n=1 Tax=Neohortaea acidophila TaxID=245834 RepID=A0A6A6PQF5_9PEZI|nr:mitotic checkpoint regulator, MAD2B-interacting-domain-containing protein [Neohortaea acidophila]KAF2481673.1 mitotic checkpoint regulator, MAD2B-interacting-domain-containing protein [Neohortaea acidophila]